MGYGAWEIGFLRKRGLRKSSSIKSGSLNETNRLLREGGKSQGHERMREDGIVGRRA